MKKFLKLTTGQAMRYLLSGSDTITCRSSGKSRRKNTEFAHYRGDVSVTIVMPACGDGFGCEDDAVALREYVDSAERELYSALGRDKVRQVVDNMREALENVDHGVGSDSIVLYANEHFSTIVKLPLDLESEVMISRDFDLRPLCRARQQDKMYYIVAIGKGGVRVVEVHNDKKVKGIYSAPKDKTSTDKEFYILVNEEFHGLYDNNPLPVVLAGDPKDMARYERRMDDPESVFARVDGDFDGASPHDIMTSVLPEMNRARGDKRRGYFESIDIGASSGLLVTGLKPIFETALAGKADILFLESNFAAEGVLSRNGVKVYFSGEGEVKSHDILHLLLWNVTHNGGCVAFMEDGTLSEYGGIALVKRL